jgi:uncharacterized protein YijF (DUF1287 family)
MRTLAILFAIGVCGFPRASAQSAERDSFFLRLVDAAVERTTHRVTYDGSYRGIPYPGGDLPSDVGVCTDLIVRSYRAVGVDLQRLVHEDMTSDFAAYPDTWGLEAPDPNIDHRRVPNLQVFLRRQGAELPATNQPADYRPGDVVTWMLPGNLPHIGLVIDRPSADGRRPLVVHNIGNGPEIEDALFDYPVTGHYRYRPDHP